MQKLLINSHRRSCRRFSSCTLFIQIVVVRSFVLSCIFLFCYLFENIVHVRVQRTYSYISYNMRWEKILSSCSMFIHALGTGCLSVVTWIVSPRYRLYVWLYECCERRTKVLLFVKCVYSARTRMSWWWAGGALWSWYYMPTHATKSVVNSEKWY